MVRSRYSVVALVVASLLLMVGPVRASLSREDKELVKDSMRSMKSISDDSRVARENTKDEHIRSFASSVVGGHDKLVLQLRDIAEKNGFTYSEEPGSTDKAETHRLDKLSGKELDKAYLEATIRDHEALLDIFKKGAQNAKNEDLRKFYDQKQDAVRDHLDKAKSLQHELKD